MHETPRSSPRRCCDNRVVDVVTRRLGPDDWEAWRSVRLRALADSPAAFDSRLADWIDASDDRWRSRMVDVPLNVLALIDDDPVGQVGATVGDAADSIELISMWVSPTARGRGVGDALIDAVTEWGVGRGAGVVGLCVMKANDAARRLYERHGFRFDGVGACDDQLRMTRSLASVPDPAS